MATVYPFDPSGTSSANRITNEQHVITAQNFRDYHYVIPKFAPFFEANFTIRMQYANGTTRNLVLGVDYYFSNQFLDASRACAKPVYGSISFLDTDEAGVLSISYNTVGGIWNIDAAEITRILAEEMRNPRITTWEQITYLPERFPVVDHEWDLIDMVGASSMVTAIEQVREAILSANGGGLTDHINNYSNPHNVNKTQVGLGNVQDFAIASTAQAQAGTSNSFYMTPLRVKEAIQSIGGAMINTHAANVNNPHNTTKAQVGLGSVQDYAVASTAQAQAGAVDNAYMTPLKTAQAITALVGTAYAAHAANTLNPHNVTKDQVGLFNLQNYAVATAEEARAGTLNDRYMTPLRTTQLVTEFVTTQLDGHATRTDNPHQVDKAQVGLNNVQNFPIATQAEAQAGISNTTYMTPGRTLDAITALSVSRAHLDDKNNPHEVSAEQVGAYTTTQTDTLLANYVRLTDDWVAGMTAAAFTAQVLLGTAANAATVDGHSVAALMLRAKQELDPGYVQTGFVYSRDTAKVGTDPVAKPNRWVQIAMVRGIAAIDQGEDDSIDATYPDTYFLIAGGHKQEAGAANNAAKSPVYMLHAKSGGVVGDVAFDITRLNGETDSDVKFGYTFTGGNMEIWVRTAHGHNEIQVSRLFELGSDNDLNAQNVDVEPAGIVYVDPVSTGSMAAIEALTDRVTALEETVNSVGVA